MSSLADVRRLLGFSHQRQQQCERRRDQAQRALLPLEHELGGIEQQISALKNLLASHRAEAQRLDQSGLLALLRRQAVIRRQIGNVALEQARVVGQRDGVVRQIEGLQGQYKKLQMKHLKYQSLEQRLLVIRRKNQLRQEETDIEELLVSLK